MLNNYTDFPSDFKRSWKIENKIEAVIIHKILIELKIINDTAYAPTPNRTNNKRNFIAIDLLKSPDIIFPFNLSIILP